MNRVAGNSVCCLNGRSEDSRVHEAIEQGRALGNAANPVRTELQYARTPRAEQAVEVVQIHEDGTGCAAGGAGTPKVGGNIHRE